MLNCYQHILRTFFNINKMKLKISKEENELMTFITFKMMFTAKLACISIYDIIAAASRDGIYEHTTKRKLNILLKHVDRYDDYLRKIYGKNLDYFNVCYSKFNYQICENVKAYHEAILKRCDYIGKKYTAAQIEVAIDLVKLANDTYNSNMRLAHQDNPKLPYLPFFDMTKILSELVRFNQFIVNDNMKIEYKEDDKIDILSILKSKINSEKIIFHCINDKASNGKRYWSPVEISYLKSNYEHTRNSELSKIMGRSTRQLYYMANRLKLHKSKAIIADMAREKAIDPDFPFRQHIFKKGQVAYNKGLKQADYMSAEAIERTKKTRFQKGHKPANMTEIGTKIKDTDGYEIIKVANPSTWEYTHRYLWKQHNGDIPKDHIVRFKDGDKTHITIDNLELISLKENMMKNSIQRYPEELRNTILYLGSLNRRLNKKLKELNK